LNLIRDHHISTVIVHEEQIINRHDHSTISRLYSSATCWFYFTWALKKLNVNNNEGLDLISTIRIMRLFKLFNHHPGLKVIITSMKYSSSVLWLLIFFVLIAVCIFASLIYYAERMTTQHADENMFNSIPDALWFNMITMSTIGYGDLYPKTMLGMLIGGVSTGSFHETNHFCLSKKYMLPNASTNSCRCINY
jgi:hypothetical protein